MSFSKKNRIRVFSGILLTSEEINVLVFRGTQTQAEWLKNLNANQQQYISPTGKAISEVHEEFFQLTSELTPAISETVKDLEPTNNSFLYYGTKFGSSSSNISSFRNRSKSSSTQRTNSALCLCQPQSVFSYPGSNS